MFTGVRHTLFLIFPEVLSASVDTLPQTGRANQYIGKSGFFHIQNQPLRKHLAVQTRHVERLSY